MAKEEIKRTFAYSETHNKILAAIADLMSPDEYTKKKKEHAGFDFVEETKNIRETAIFPTVKEIAKKSGFSESIIKSHIKDLKFSNFKGTFQTLTPIIMMNFGKNCIKNAKASDVKLWMQIVEDWEESSQLKSEHSGTLEVKVKREIISVKK